MKFSCACAKGLREEQIESFLCSSCNEENTGIKQEFQMDTSKSMHRTDNSETILFWFRPRPEPRSEEWVWSVSLKMVNAKPVICIETNEVFPSVRAAARKYGGTHNAIQDSIKKGVRAYGSHWDFFCPVPADEEEYSNRRY
eukprot:g9441.t1